MRIHKNPPPALGLTKKSRLPMFRLASTSQHSWIGRMIASMNLLSNPSSRGGDSSEYGWTEKQG